MSRKLKFLLLSLIAIAIMLVDPYKLIVVRGNSMYPTLKNGNILLGKKSNYFKRGDIVVAQNDAFEKIIKTLHPVEGYSLCYNVGGNVTFLSKACFNIGIQTSIIEFKSGINIYLLIILDNNDLTKESVIKLVICKKNEYVYEDYQNLF